MAGVTRIYCPVPGAASVTRLLCPNNPEVERCETLCHHMQAGPGILGGNLCFSQVESDFRECTKDFDANVTPLYLLTVEYDYSRSPQDTSETAPNLDVLMRESCPGSATFR